MKKTKEKKTNENFSLSFNVEKCRKWCIDIQYNFAMLSNSAYFIQRRVHQILESDEFFVDNWKKWWRCWFCINWFHQSQDQSMNDRETRYLLNKYRRIDVTFINRFFHFCAFCSFARTNFHSTSFVRLQT
jgi:hypothetical protein